MNIVNHSNALLILSQNSIYVSRLRELNRFRLRLQQFDVFNYVLCQRPDTKSLHDFSLHQFLMIFIVSIITTYFLSTSSQKTPVLCLYFGFTLKKFHSEFYLGEKQVCNF